MKRKRIIVYWEFVIDIFGPCCKDKAERRRIRRILSRKRLRQVEEAALPGMAASVEEDLDGRPIDTHTVRLRLDQGSAVSYGWSESTDHKALFAGDAVYGQDDQVVAYSGGTTALAKQLATAQTLAFQFTPFDANPAIARFDLRGLGSHLGKVADACKWDAN